MPQILVVDDEVYIRELIKTALASRGHVVTAFDNGNDAIEYVKQNPIDVAIIDLVMPQKGGIETLMEMRDSNRDIKIIAISGKIETKTDAIQGLAQQFNVDTVLSKPFDIDEMIQLVEELA
jgi:CheY-like chemotaxis protein